MPPAAAPSLSLALRLQKYTLLSGIFMVFVCCLQGAAIDGMANKAMGKGANYQLSHNGELLITLAFAFPFFSLSPTLLWATMVLLQIGAWANPLSYLIVAVTNCPQPMFANTPGNSTLTPKPQTLNPKP